MTAATGSREVETSDVELQIDPDAHLTYLLAKVSHHLQVQLDAALQRDAGLSLTQFSALAHIRRCGEITLSDLARTLLTSPQAAGTLAARLVRDGHVLRSSEGPGLPVRLTLTTAGTGALRIAADVATHAEEDALRALTPRQRTTVMDLLRPLVPAPPR